MFDDQEVDNYVGNAGWYGAMKRRKERVKGERLGRTDRATAGVANGKKQPAGNIIILLSHSNLNHEREQQ